MTIDTDYLCTCTKLNEFYANLIVEKLPDNITILNKELVLRTPPATDQWEDFCRTAITNYKTNTPL